MAIDDGEVGPAVGRMLGTIFEAIEEGARLERASDPPLLRMTKGPLPSVSNVVVRMESEELVIWFELCNQKYTFKRAYLIDGVPLASLPDPLASVREFISSRRGSFSAQLSLLDHTERVLFRGVDRSERELGVGVRPNDVEAFIPGKWVEDFLKLSQDIEGSAR